MSKSWNNLKGIWLHSSLVGGFDHILITHLKQTQIFGIKTGNLALCCHNDVGADQASSLNLLRLVSYTCQSNSFTIHALNIRMYHSNHITSTGFCQLASNLNMVLCFYLGKKKT